MANVDNPHGLRPLGRSLYGGPSSLMRAAKLVGNGVALFQQDAVFKAASSTGKIPAIDKTGTPGTTPYLGVNLIYGALNTATEHLVIPATGNVFECQDNNSTDGVEAASITKNANLQLNAGSAVTQMSGHELNEATINTTATLDVHILKLLEVEGNAYGGWARVEVAFNGVALGPQAAGV